MKRIFLYKLLLAGIICIQPALAAEADTHERHAVTAPRKVDDVDLAADAHTGIKGWQTSIDSRRLETAIQRSANYLSRVCDASGQTATRIEGLLAVLTFLPPEYSRLRHRITEKVTRGMHFLMNAQVSEGRYCGAIPRGIHPLPEGHPGFSRAFDRRVSEVRIDYVQHTLSAMIQYQRLFYR